MSQDQHSDQTEDLAQGLGEAFPPSYEEAIGHIANDDLPVTATAAHQRDIRSSSSSSGGVASQSFNINGEIQNSDDERHDVDDGVVETTPLNRDQIPDTHLHRPFIQPAASSSNPSPMGVGNSNSSGANNHGDPHHHRRHHHNAFRDVGHQRPLHQHHRPYGLHYGHPHQRHHLHPQYNRPDHPRMPDGVAVPSPEAQTEPISSDPSSGGIPSKQASFPGPPSFPYYYAPPYPPGQPPFDGLGMFGRPPSHLNMPHGPGVPFNGGISGSFGLNLQHESAYQTPTSMFPFMERPPRPPLAPLAPPAPLVPPVLPSEPSASSASPSISTASPLSVPIATASEGDSLESQPRSGPWSDSTSHSEKERLHPVLQPPPASISAPVVTPSAPQIPITTTSLSTAANAIETLDRTSMATTAAAAAMEGGIGSMSAPTIDARTSTAAADDDLESHFPFFRPPASIPLLNEATSTAGLISSQDISIATYTRSKRGVETVDPIFDDPYQLYRFFVAHNDRPSMHILITGSHVEKRSSEERMADGTTKVIHQKHKVTDFKIDFDLTPYILPTGTLMTLPDPKTGIQPTLRDVMEEHVEEENPFKELHMEKKVIWDYEHLTRTITQAIRSINYRYTIEISYPIMNNRVVVHSSSPLANLMRSNWTKALCFMSVVGMIAYPLREMYKKVKDKVLQSEFQMAISTTDFFNVKYWEIIDQVQYS